MYRNDARYYLIAAVAALGLSACGGGSNDDTVEQEAELQFQPTASVVPSPNSLAFQGSDDGTLNNTGNASVDALDGFSTLNSATATATVPIDPNSLEAGANVRVFEVTTQGEPNTTDGDPTQPPTAGPKPINGIPAGGELQADAQFRASLSAADRNNRTLAVTPVTALKPDTSYLVVVTDGLQAQGGGAIGASRQYELAKRANPLVDENKDSTVEGLSDNEANSLENVRQIVGGVDINSDGVPELGHMPVLETETNLSSEDIVLSWQFRTQNIGNVIAAVATRAGGPDVTLGAASFADAGSTPGDAADIKQGVLTGLPYYLAAPSDANEPTANDDAPRTEFWEADTAVAGERNLTGQNSTPSERTTVSVPVLVTVPKTGCSSPCPVAIFQHGITTNRLSALRIADTLASIGYATVAIDLPLHGVVDPRQKFEPLQLESIERTFNLDLVNNADGSEGPDGQIDSSGTHFINLKSLRTSRDNLRQAVADLLALVNGGLAAIDGRLSADLAENDVDYIGQSLGGIVGVPFLAEAGADIDRAVLAAPASGVAKTLDGSPRFGPQIEAGIEAQGPVKGTPSYEQFLGAAQAAIDTSDPLNYADRAVGAIGDDTDLLMYEIVGGNSSPADQVIPNNLRPEFQQGVPEGTIPSVTAGTDPLSERMGLKQIGSSNSPSSAGTDTIVRFTAGAHSSLIKVDSDTDPNGEVNKEMQSIVGTFLSSGVTEITNGSVVADP